MKIQTVIVLSLVVTVLAVPEIRERRAAANKTSSSQSNSKSEGVDCGSGKPKGLRPLLGQLGVILDNLLINVGKLKIKGVTGSKGDLLDLSKTLLAVRELLSHLLGGTNLSSESTPGNEELVAGLIRSLTKALDKILGGGSGNKAACNNNGGLLGNLLGSLTDGVLGDALAPVLDIVGKLLKGLAG